MALISVENLSVGYRTQKGVLHAVDNISFSLKQGRSLGFVGESGCGKTTVGMTLMGLLPENASVLQGDIFFNGKNFATFDEVEWRSARGNDISMIFQAAMNALNPVIRVHEQIMEAIETHHQQLSKEAMIKKVKQLFSLVKIPEDRLRDYPHQYSGGMKQRAIIAMALACSPKLIIADEPTTALDVIVQDQILKGIKHIQKEMNTSLIFISHDIAVVADVCEDICVMYAGQIVEQGKSKEVFRFPKHPYTKTLLSSYLSLDTDKEIVIPQVRSAPDLINISKGCRFAANCTSDSEMCEDQTPSWVDISSTHKAFCRMNVINKANDD